jgi:gas vesicle protein
MMRNHEAQTPPVMYVLPAFFVGVLFGAGAGVLYAPYRGTIVRRRLKRYANRTIEDAMESGREAWDAAADALDQGKEYLEDRTDHMKKIVRQGWARLTA